MTDGYIEFEFDLPEALLAKLVRVFEGVKAAPLLTTYVEKNIPEEQGVYQLFLRSDEGERLVYIGKTDAEAGLKRRLYRHAEKIHHRRNLDPGSVLFKAVRVFVFTAVDLEAQLIRHYGGLSEVDWNGSGFGSNDPGRERDTTNYKEDHFDTRYPIDIERPLEFAVPDQGSAAEILKLLKQKLPYLIRFQTISRNSRQGHTDLESSRVSIDSTILRTPESVIRQVIEQLPAGWHATMLPSHIIIYKDDTRNFPSGRTLARSGPLLDISSPDK